MMLLDKIIEELEKAADAGDFTNASFGFPNDRIEIKDVHFGDDDKGRVGEVLHPDEYIKRITRLYRRSWIVPPIKRVIDLLKLHADTINRAERLVEALQDVDIDALDAQIRRLSSLTKSEIPG